MDKIRFKEACDKIINKSRKQNGIGTLGEKTLHAVLKCYFEPHEDNQEISLGGYVADIAGENGVIEIQTRNFNVLRKQLNALLSLLPKEYQNGFIASIKKLNGTGRKKFLQEFYLEYEDDKLHIKTKD